MKRKLTLVFSLLTATAAMMAQDINRSAWTVNTQTHNDYGYAWDGGTQGSPTTGLPAHLFDGELGSYLSLVKPGGTYQGITPPADSEAPSFIVDMQSEQSFNYIKWGHRYGSYTNPDNSQTIAGNKYNYLRVFGILMTGSNDGTTFTPIAPTTPAGDDPTIIWIPQKVTYVASAQSDETELDSIPVVASNYRYVKVQLQVFSKNYGVGKYQHPDYPGEGSTSGNTMQISEFGLGLSSSSSIANANASGVKVYPSVVKAGQAFTITLDKASDAVVSIYSVSGAKYSEQAISGSSDITKTIAQPGVYVVTVKQNAATSVSKVIVH